MAKLLRISILLTMLLSLTIGIAYSQERGSIRGTIREDKNGDGECATEPTIEGIRIEFVSNDGQTVVYLDSGSDGTYGLVAAGLGTWKVSASPTSGYVVTSQKTIEVFLGEEQQLALGVDFCVRSDTASPVVLPASGASASPILLLTAVLGMGLVTTGLGLEWRRVKRGK